MKKKLSFIFLILILLLSCSAEKEMVVKIEDGLTIYNGVEKELSGGLKETTNNEMEMTAVFKALEALKFPCEVELYSDSAYVVNAFNQGWIYNWKKNNWKTAGKTPVKNQEIWEELYNLTKKHKVEFIKVKGHSDNEYNNRCDFLATSAIKTL